MRSYNALGINNGCLIKHTYAKEKKKRVKVWRTYYTILTQTFYRKEEAIARGRSQEVSSDASLVGIALPVKVTLAQLRILKNTCFFNLQNNLPDYFLRLADY